MPPDKSLQTPVASIPVDVLGATAGWFARAVPSPNLQNQNVQVGVHFEEISEMLDTITVDTAGGRVVLAEALVAVRQLAKGLKEGQFKLTITDRKEFFDAILDQIVTAAGCGHMHGMEVVQGLNVVNASNWSKFDDNGCPIFNEHGKIAKGPNYFKPDLDGFY